MKRQWRMRRQTTPYPDGQQRWDRAYHYLLQWTQPVPPNLSRPAVETPPQVPEVHDASRHLCSGLDHPSSPGTDD
jgi:hypothetical protein